MYTRHLAAAALCAVLCLLSSGAARATLIAAYDFQDTNADGELAGEAGGSGWAGTWTAQTGVTQLLALGTPLSYDVPGGGTVAASSVLQITGNNDALLARNLAAAQSGDVYISFLLKFNTTDVGSNKFAVWWFNDRDKANIGIKTNQGGSLLDFIARNASTDAGGYAPDQLVPGRTYLVVGRFYKSGSGNYDRYALWVDPAFTDGGSPEAQTTTASSISSFTNVGMRVANLAAGDEIQIGALRLGTEWRDVVPEAVPEPSALALAALAMLGLATFATLRRRP